MEGFKDCRKCGASCDEAFKFCPNCGASLEADKCPQCGAELIDGAKFCVNCGARVDEEPVHEEPVHEDEIHQEEEKVTAEDDEAIDEIAPKTAAVKPAVQPEKKPATTKSAKMNYIVRIIKNASVFVLCAILFALSFCNIIKLNADTYFDFRVDGCEVSVSAVDVIEIMFSTANADEDKYADEFEELTLSLREAVQKDYNERLNKYFLSNKTKALIHDAMVSYYKYNLADEEQIGSSVYNNVIIAGVFCFMNILFTAAMFIVSIISLVLVSLKKKNKVAKYLYALPAYLFATLLILFIVKTTLGAGATVASAMGATLFFELLAIIATVVLIFSAKKKKVIKNAIPKLVAIATSIIICACLFAPVFTAKCDLVLQNRTHQNTYSISVDAAGLLTYLPPSEVEELSDQTLDEETYSRYIDHIEYLLNRMTYLSAYEIKGDEGEVLARYVMVMLIYAAGDYSATSAISTGYYVLLLVFMLFGVFAICAIASLFKKDNSIYCLFIPILVLLITALGCSVGWICVMNYHLDDLACSFTVGGGLISAIILSMVTLVFVGIFSSVANKEKRIRTYDELDSLSSDVESIE